LALDRKKGADLTTWARSLPRATAILVVSAHFRERRVTLGATDRVPLIYDFGGFPDELYQMTYPCPGAPALADRVATLLAPEPVTRSAERGLDHGAWVPLRHMFPAADVPVLELSLTHRALPADVVALGRRLAPVRAEGVLLLGSGSLTHNLGRLDFDEREPPPRWATEFDAFCAESLASLDVDALCDFRNRAPSAQVAHPTDEHFLPLLFAVGAATAAGATNVRVGFPITGFELGSLSRRCVQLG
jgi:4,5-DOPA dioxygenase extradiol